MDGNEILLLGLGIQSPWELADQRLDTDKTPHELHLEVKAERGSKYAPARSAASRVRPTTFRRRRGGTCTFSSIIATSMRRFPGSSVLIMG